MPGTMTETAPGVWRLRVFVGRRPNGTPIQHSKTVRGGKRKAQQELAKLATAHQGKAAAGSETVNDLLDMFLERAATLGRSPTTIAEYRRIAEKVVRPQLGMLKLSRLSARDLDGLYARLTERGNKATTVRRVHALLSAALHQAERWDLVSVSVARKATPPPIHPDEVKAPSPEDVRALLAEAEEREPMMAVLLCMAALTGARRGELCALRWSDIDFDTNTLTIARSVYDVGAGWAEKPTKTHARRRVFLDEYAAMVLRRHRESVDKLAGDLGLMVPDDAFVFSRSPVGAEPVPPRVVTQFAVRAAKAAGLDLHLHQLRHFSATQAVSAGYDVRTVAGRLGHRDANVTLRVYAHALEARDAELAASLGRTLALPASVTT